MAKKIFDSVRTRGVKKNKFDLSHEKKLSLKFNNLYPMYLEEIVPGDRFSVNSEILLRMAPMLAPMMHRVNVYTHYFFVPNRLVWNEWEDFITGGEEGTAQPVFPTITVSNTRRANFEKGTLSDYMGVPIPAATGLTPTEISALPFRAYQNIYNEYYRDQNLEDKVAYSKTSGATAEPEQTEITTLRKRAWEKDYFTSALPWSQRGGEAQIPLGQVTPNYLPVTEVEKSSNGVPSSSNNPIYTSSGDAVQDISGGGSADTLQIKNLDNMDVDATTINDLRRASKLQMWLEKQARGGSRYIETILSHFGTKSSDARLQRPEYLGGGKQPVVISEVLNTTGTTDNAQGDLAGHGISVGHQNKFARTFEEHGFVIGIMSIIPTTAYQNGLHKKWSKFDKFDYYWPTFANLGEQEVNVSELYCDFKDDTAFERVFGYQQRYSEYKYHESMVHGDMRDTLDFWHLGRQFTTEPVLNETFIHADARTNIFAVEDGTDYLWCQIYNKVSAIRPMPYFSIPQL